MADGKKKVSKRSAKMASVIASEQNMAAAERKEAETLSRQMDGGEGDDMLEQAVMAHMALADAHEERAALLEQEMETEAEEEQEQEREEELSADGETPLWEKAGDAAISGAVRGACVQGAVQTARENNPELFDSMKKHWAKLDAGRAREIHNRPAPSALAAGEFADAAKAAELVAEVGPVAGLG